MVSPTRGLLSEMKANSFHCRLQFAVVIMANVDQVVVYAIRDGREAFVTKV